MGLEASLNDRLMQVIEMAALPVMARIAANETILLICVKSKIPTRFFFEKIFECVNEFLDAVRSKLIGKKTIDYTIFDGTLKY